ncbi:MAG: alkaline phosphatase family protein [Saprospiraceae bacterium]|nr:alkaline phosphatase family protein [Saprospiraceae bacterium]
MKNQLFVIIALLMLNACTAPQTVTDAKQDLTIAFGSCNNQRLDNYLWKEIVKHRPSVWIWGGDNVYSDTTDMLVLKKDYETVLNHPDYKKLKSHAKVLGTWDDHDYGLNDGGVHYAAKKQSQQAFLDFMGVSKNDKRRQQEGVYHAETIKTKGGTVKIIVLDTRYFRSDLTKSANPKRRYDANTYGEGTMLGDTQWAWLTNELTHSQADFNLIMSSVQVFSDEHGYEKWGNMPHEVDKLLNTIRTSKAKGVIILSGDRHISEFSKRNTEGVPYPLIDFTSSGLTHASEGNTSEPNRYRVGSIVPKISYGLLLFDFKNKTVRMQIRGKEDALLSELKQEY